jgi:tRNA nucleotidyltransferase (CCA-adding enzyme)
MKEDGIGHFYGHAQVSVELARKTLNDLRCDNATKDTVLLLIKYHDHVIEPNEKHVRRMLSKIGEENLEMLLQLKTADNLAQAPKYRTRVKEYEEIRRIISEIKAKGECFSLKHLAVKGEDIILLGAKGPKIGKILNSLLSLVIDGTMPNEKEALLKKASKLLDEF